MDGHLAERRVKLCDEIARICAFHDLPLVAAPRPARGFLANRPQETQMRKKEFTESQIVATLQQVEGGRQAKDVCRELRISGALYNDWKCRYSGMNAADVLRARDLGNGVQQA
jgi:hypothetical protein